MVLPIRALDSREIPDHRLARTGFEQSVIRVAVAIEIGRTGHSPARRKSRSGAPADINVVIQKPNGRLLRARLIEQEIWFAVTVEVGWWIPAGSRRA